MTNAPAIKQNSNGVWQLEGEQLWDSDILPVCLDHIKEDDTVIDAGAWIGGHAMAYMEKTGSKGIVFAFEPNPDAYKCLVLNTQRPPNNCTTLKVALGDQDCAINFTVKRGWYDSGHVGGEQYLHEVKMDCLDNYRITPNFIKIDVEGCELKVLKGAAKTIEKFRPTMCIEVNHAALKRQGDTAGEVFTWIGKNKYLWEVIEKGVTPNAEVFNLLVMPV